MRFTMEIVPKTNLPSRLINSLRNFSKNIHKFGVAHKFLSLTISVVSLAVIAGTTWAAQQFFSSAQAAADINITVDLTKSIGTNNMSTGVTHTQYSADTWNDATAVASAKQLLQASTVFQNQHIMGWGADDPEPSAGTFNWGSLDGRVQLMRSTGGTMVITLCCSPGWMRPSGYQDDWTYLETAPDPSHVGDFANLAKAVAQRYPDVKYFQVWNELKGMWGSSPGCTPSVCGQNRWDYERYTTLYNAVYDAIKSVRPDALIGGPYVVADTWSSRNQSNPSNISGPYGVLDQRPLDVIMYWLVNKHGADFITVDGGPGPKDGTWVTDEFTAGSYFVDVYNWVRSLDPAKYPGATSLPFFWAEWYASMPQKGLNINHDTAVMANDLIFTAKSGAGLPLVWEAQGDTSGFAFPVAIWTDTRVSGGGQATPFYGVQKAFKDNFPPGTTLYNATSTSTDAAVLASATQALIVNKSANTHYVSVNGQSPATLGAYQTIVVPVLASSTPTPTPTLIPTPLVTPGPTSQPSGGITLRALSTSTNTSKSSSFIINKPAGVVAGDVIVAQITVTQAKVSITPPGGWTLVRRDQTTNSIAEVLYYKVASGSEPASYKWTFSSAQKASGGIVAYAGVNNTSPVDASSGRYNDSTSKVTAPSITTTIPNDQLLFFVAVTAGTTVSTPTGMIEEWSVSTSNTTSKLADKQLALAGATGDVTATENASYSNIAQLVALKPAVASSTPLPTTAATITPTPTATVVPTPTPLPVGISLKNTSSANNGGGSTTLSIGAPAGVAAGDVMMAQVTVRGATTTTIPPSGWSRIRRDTSSFSIANEVYYHVVSGSEPSSYVWTFSGSQAASGWIANYSGVNTTSPIDVSSGQYNDSTSTITAPSVTTTAANDRLLFIVAVTTSTSVAPPAGFTQQVLVSNTGNTTSYVADKALSSAGATGNQVGKEGASNSNIGVLVTLRAQ